MEWDIIEVAGCLGVSVEVLLRFLASKNVTKIPDRFTQLQRDKVVEAFERAYPNGLDSEDTGHPEVPSEPVIKATEDGPWNGSYADYLRSERWRLKREEILQHYGYQCMLCGRFDLFGKFEVHHNKYRDGSGCVLGRETHHDCLPLCQKCHARHHDAIDRGQRQP